jgi:hypothetical protein
MGTTASGLRYPEPSEPVAQGATAIRNLAEDVTGKYPPGVRPGAAFYPDAGVVPAGAVIRMAAGKVNLTCDSAGQAVLYFSPAFTTGILSVLLTPGVSPSAPMDYVFSAAPRGLDSVYFYCMKAGVKFVGIVGVNYLAFGY